MSVLSQQAKEEKIFCVTFIFSFPISKFALTPPNVIFLLCSGVLLFN